MTHPADTLFVYGTLMFPDIMQAVCGRVPPATPARLERYRCGPIRGEVYPGLVPDPGGKVTGLCYTGLTADELARLDAYEGGGYQRVRCEVAGEGGTRQPAWTYRLQDARKHRLGDRSWDAAAFERRHLRDYLHDLGD